MVFLTWTAIMTANPKVRQIWRWVGADAPSEEKSRHPAHPRKTRMKVPQISEAQRTTLSTVDMLSMIWIFFPKNEMKL